VMVFTAAPMIAPLLGSWLVTEWGWHAPFAATAFAGVLILFGIKSALRETHAPVIQSHIASQLRQSFLRFFSYRRSIFGVLIAAVTVVGIMALVSGSAALIIEIYAFPVQHFGYLFALTGVAILTGSVINRHLLLRFDAIQMIGVGAVLAGLAGIQLLIMSWLGHAPFWWIWGNVCLFMSATGFLMPNATALALDPVPEIAGMAASFIGTIQSVAAAGSAIISSMFYTGTILNVALVVGLSGLAVATIYLFRGKILNHPE